MQMIPGARNTLQTAHFTLKGALHISASCIYAAALLLPHALLLIILLACSLERDTNEA